jgi:hypothetical protein
LGIFSKKLEYCSLCKKQLRFKYKPEKSWNIEGKLCGDCHTIKVKEFIDAQAKVKEIERIKDNTCSLCNKLIESERKHPRWQWNMESDAVLCNNCYLEKEKEYMERLNFCSACKKKLGFVRYNPKPAWKVNGQLCRQCWDRLNTV